MRCRPRRRQIISSEEVHVRTIKLKLIVYTSFISSNIKH